MRDKEARRGMREDGKEGRERKRGGNFHLEAPWWEPGAEQRRRIGLHFASAIYLHLFDLVQHPARYFLIVDTWRKDRDLSSYSPGAVAWLQKFDEHHIIDTLGTASRGQPAPELAVLAVHGRAAREKAALSCGAAVTRKGELRSCYFKGSPTRARRTQRTQSQAFDYDST